MQRARPFLQTLGTAAAPRNWPLASFRQTANVDAGVDHHRQRPQRRADQKEGRRKETRFADDAKAPVVLPLPERPEDRERARQRAEAHRSQQEADLEDIHFLDRYIDYRNPNNNPLYNEDRITMPDYRSFLFGNRGRRQDRRNDDRRNSYASETSVVETRGVAGGVARTSFRWFATFVAIMIRLTLILVVAVNLVITSILIQRFINIANLSPFRSFGGGLGAGVQLPGPLILSEVVSAATLANLLFSCCCIAACPLLVAIGDAFSVVAWFVATIVLGANLGQTLQLSCQDVALLTVSAIVNRGGLLGAAQANAITAFGVGTTGGAAGSSFGNAGFGGSGTLTGRIFDACNLIKTLFAFHVIATALFIGSSLFAACSTVGRWNRQRSETRHTRHHRHEHNRHDGKHRYESKAYNAAYDQPPPPFQAAVAPPLQTVPMQNVAYAPQPVQAYPVQQIPIAVPAPVVAGAPTPPVQAQAPAVSHTHYHSVPLPPTPYTPYTRRSSRRHHRDRHDRHDRHRRYDRYERADYAPATPARRAGEIVI